MTPQPALDPRLVSFLKCLQDGFGPSKVRETLARMNDDGTIRPEEVRTDPSGTGVDPTHPNRSENRP